MKTLIAALFGLAAYLLAGARKSESKIPEAKLIPLPDTRRRAVRIEEDPLQPATLVLDPRAEIPDAPWEARAAAAQYLDAFHQAEERYGLPRHLLSRVAFQESRYNPTALSPKGAMGIMQFLPATAADFGIDPNEPFQAIDAAGRYLAQLKARFGTWTEALAAYNWGQGNVARNGIEKAPPETRAYVSAIAADVLGA